MSSIKKNLIKKAKFEIISVDDNSPDDTGIECNKKFKNDKYVKVILNKKRIGFSESIYKEF